MAKFTGKTKRQMGSFSTSSMSDIVFTILFFFMVTTTMRTNEVKVTTSLPKASEVAKLERKDLTSYILIGTPIKSEQAKMGTGTRIQLNDSFVKDNEKLEEITNFIGSEREQLDESDKGLMTVALKIDKDVMMGIVSDVKQELRRCSALKIMYTAIKDDGKN